MSDGDRADAQGRIRRLRPEVVAKIAAGEMILRPLSVAKELLENSLDAGARRIEIEVREAADRYLACADDGCGMSEVDCLLAVERHATSKITEEVDLLDVKTLGFRGEALPSIARVAQLKILTSMDGAGGTEVRLRGGHVEGVRPGARGRGTTVEVEDLFFNSPVRKRFLRSPAGEIRLIQKLVATYGLAHPDVDFRFTADGRVVSHLVATDPLTRLEQVHGPRFREKVLPLSGESPRARIEGWIGIPEIARAGTGAQTILVNGRWVSYPSLGHALRQGFGDLIPAMRQPFAVLLLSVPSGSVDVNVHPTKREVRFLMEGEVFGEIVRAVREATRRLVPGLGGGERGWMSAGSLRITDSGATPQETLELLYRPDANAVPVVADAPPSADEGEKRNAPMVPVWQVQDRYVVAQTRQGILIIDQHAAHERVLYERALRWLDGEEAASQQLLFPVVVQLAPGESEMLESVVDELPRLGIHVEPFGGDAVVLRAVPATWEGDPAAMLRDLLDDVSDRTRRREERAQALAASFACHSAIRSGAKLDIASMNRLIDELFATGLPHGDPHGRPTYVVLTVEELDRRFGRA